MGAGQVVHWAYDRHSVKCLFSKSRVGWRRLRNVSWLLCGCDTRKV